MALACLPSCNKGFTLKIGDQDIFAFGSQDGCNFVQNGQGVRVSWKSSTPFHLIITANVPTEWDEPITRAAATWNSMKRMNLIEVHRDNSYPNAPGGDGTNGIYWMTEWEADKKAEQARTAVKWDISKIKEVDIRINAKNFRFFKTGDADTAGKINIESLMLHELGHGLGLKHIENATSTMQPYLAPGVSRNVPGEIDTNSLNCEY